jgi:hypothetical protein
MLLDYFRLIFNVKKCNVDSLKTKTPTTNRGFLETATDSDHLRIDHYYKKSFFSFKEKSHLNEIFFQWRLSINLIWSRKMFAEKFLNLFKKDRILRFFSITSELSSVKSKNEHNEYNQTFTLNNLEIMEFFHV